MTDSEANIIYVVDDEPAVPEFVGQLLLMDNKSYQVECFATAEAVLARMQTREPCLLVSDIWMPGTDGIKLLRQCRDKFPEVEVILITAAPTMPTVLEAIRYEAFAYLEKPFSPEQLKIAVRRALAKRRMLRLARVQLEKEQGPKGLDASVTGAGSFFAAAWEYLPGETLVLDSSLRIVSANRAARTRFNLGRRLKPRIQDTPPLEQLEGLAIQASGITDSPAAALISEIEGRSVRVRWAEFMDGVKFCLVWFG